MIRISLYTTTTILVGLSLTLSCLAAIRLPELLAVVSSDKYSVAPQLAAFSSLFPPKDTFIQIY